MVEPDVVADRRDHRDVGDKIDRGERGPSGGDRMDELDRDMRGVAARAAVAHREQPPAAAIDPCNGLGRRDQNRRLGAEEGGVGVARVARLVRDRLQERRFELFRLLRRAVQEGIEGFEISLLCHGLATLQGLAVRRIASSSACASPSSARMRKVSAASASSRRLMAKPTWISTQSPTQDDAGWSSLMMQAMLTSRLTPPTSTVASFLAGSSIFSMRPGIPRHMALIPWFDLRSGSSLRRRSDARRRSPPVRAQGPRRWREPEHARAP